VSRSTLLYYNAIGPLSPTSHSATGYRLYEKSSPELHRKVLKFLGFTEGEIRELISRLYEKCEHCDPQRLLLRSWSYSIIIRLHS
jgi:DNA-binding transcriptional MerR regulator